MKVLVIGGAGYIGSHVVKDLCDAGFKVTVFDNLNTGYRSNIDKRASFVKGDILDIKKLDSVMSKGFDAVFDFAGLKAAGESMFEPEKYSTNNITGTINILNAMTKNKVKYFVFSSSAAVYGSPKYIPMDDDHPTNPENYYGFTKLEIEKILKWYSDLKSVRFAALRYFNAAGYGTINGLEKNPGNLLPIVMEVASGRRKSITINGDDYDTPDGTCVRDYIHVLDLSSAHIKALKFLETKNKDLTVNLSTGKGSSVLEVIKKTEKITGKKVKYTIGPRRAGDPATVVAASKIANKILGWKPEHSEMDNIIKTMWRVYKK